MIDGTNVIDKTPNEHSIINHLTMIDTLKNSADKRKCTVHQMLSSQWYASCLPPFTMDGYICWGKSAKEKTKRRL